MRYYDYIRRRPRPICKNIIQIGQQGERGERGEQGIQGVQGETGPTGPRGRGVEARNTFTTEPNTEAKVISTQTDETIFLDFYIPKGDYGVSEPLQVGNVSTVDSSLFAEVEDRYEDGIHYLDFAIPRGSKGEQGERGLQGAQGVQGVQGATGPTGPKGEKGDIGPRGLPGEIGISETIVVDATQTVEADQDADVIDAQVGKAHHLTFYIPQGATGPKGDQGERGLTGEQGPRGEKGEAGAKGDTGEKGDVGPAGPKGDRGETGATGEMGPTGPKGDTGSAGPSGLTPNIYAVVCNMSAQSVSDGDTFVLNEEVSKSELTLANNAIEATSNGTYLISFSVNFADGAAAGSDVAVAVNGEAKVWSRRAFAVNSNADATFVLPLSAGDKVSLVARTSAQRSISASSGPSAMLTVVLIAT